MKSIIKIAVIFYYLLFSGFSSAVILPGSTHWSAFGVGYDSLDACLPAVVAFYEKGFNNGTVCTPAGIFDCNYLSCRGVVKCVNTYPGRNGNGTFGTCVGMPLICPSNSSLQDGNSPIGFSCVCDDGYHEQDGQCVSPCPDNATRNSDGTCSCNSGYFRPESVTSRVKRLHPTGAASYFS